MPKMLTMGTFRPCATAFVTLAFVVPAMAQQPDPAPQATQPGATQAPQLPAVQTSPVTDPGTPAPSADPSADANLPPVEVIQQQPKPLTPPPRAAQKPKPRKKKPVQQAAPQPQAQPVVAAEDPASVPSFAPLLSTDQLRAQGDVVRTSPLAGSEIDVRKVPGTVSTVSSQTIGEPEFKEPQEALQKDVPGVILADAGGNDLRAQVEYRGFGAGSLNGFPQGLAVYQNGVRINEVFGDTVNFDLIPKNAISDMTILSGNPVFGLNAIGGAMSIVMKDGFNYQGAEIEVLGGSFGRKQVGAQVGVQSGAYAAFFAGEFIDENGWRDFSPAEVKRGYFDIGAKGSRIEAHFNLTVADSMAGVVAASPVELLAIDRDRTFTSPQTTDLNMIMPTFNVSAKVTDTFTVSTVGYYRRFKSRVIDGNVAEFEECGDVIADNPGADASGVTDNDNLCAEEIEDDEIEQILDQNGNPINPDALGLDEPFGVIDRIRTDSESFGFSLQGVEKAKLFGHNNHFIAGVSYDQGNVNYKTSSEFGTIGNRFVVNGSGIILNEPDDFAPRNVDVDTRYFGAYFLNAFDVNDRLTVTVGGRYNYAKIDLEDLTGDFENITSKHSFDRFNPTVGATYEMVPGITLYGGYSEANRAPTAAELACADPENPCPIESFLTDDPPLDQVVSKTFEVGLRGQMRSPGGEQRLDWGLGFFHTTNEDDILFVSSTVTGRGYFFNAGETLRRGLEASLKYKYGPLSAYASYAYIKATYETANEFSSPAHPEAGPCAFDPTEEACINVRPGDNIPGIPNHRFKTGFDYWVTPRWKVGADLIYASGQYYYTDDANLLPKLGGYTRVDVSTSYKVSKNVEVFAFAKNIFDREYGLFGTLFESDEAPGDPVRPGFEFDEDERRSVVPAPPVSVYGGIRIKF